MSIFDEPKVDCHCHVFDPDWFPYLADTPYRPAGQEIGTRNQLEQVFAAYGVRNALLVQPNSGYDRDNRCMLDALSRSGGRFKGIAVVPNDIGADALSELKRRGVVGIAFNLPFFHEGYYADTDDLLQKLAEQDMFLQIQVHQDQLLSLLPKLDRWPVNILVDHCGRPDVSAGLDQPGFRALLDLGRSGRATIKLSGCLKFSREPFPYPDTWSYLEALVEAFSPDHCIWGSDWPFLRAPQRIDYGPLLTLAECIFPDRGDREKLFWLTPRRLFGFEV